MKKLKKLSCVILIIFILNTICFSNLNEDVSEDLQDEILEVVNNLEVDEPKIQAPTAIAFDRVSKTVMYEKNAYEKRPMASTTKIMTAIVAIENGNLEDTVVVSRKAASIGGSRLGLKTGDKVLLKDLLYGLLLCSGNDSAIAIAEHIGGDVDNFCKMMTQKAKDIGAVNTNFTSPHGLDDDMHYTTVYDLCLMADYALDIPIFSQIVKQKMHTIYINGNYKQIGNTNELLGSLQGVDGIKTGFTNKAGRCLVTSTTRDDWQIITVVLGCDTRKQRAQESTKIIEYCFKNYELVDFSKLAKQSYPKVQIDVIKGKEDVVSTHLEDKTIILPIKKVNLDNIETSYNIEKSLEAPTEENQKVGEYNITINNEIICNLDIITDEKIEKNTEKDYFKIILFNLGDYLKIKF